MNAEFQFKHKIPVQIRFSDVDQYGHMNNSVYFSLYGHCPEFCVNGNRIQL